MAELGAIRSGLRAIDLSTRVGVVRPSLAAGITIPASSAITAVGAWAQVTSSGDLSAHALTAIRIIAGNANYAQIQVAAGAAGSEVSIAMVPFLTGSGVDTVPVFPAAFVPSNERVAVRYAASSTSLGFIVKLEFSPRPY